jgi:hypothetical protein
MVSHRIAIQIAMYATAGLASEDRPVILLAIRAMIQMTEKINNAVE